MTAFNRGNRDVNSLAALAVITAINSHPGVHGGEVDQQKRYAEDRSLYNQASAPPRL